MDGLFDIVIRNDRLPLLDGLRLFAAISVVLYHVQIVGGISGTFGRGYLFVDFFFLLSGFVLTIAAEDKMNTSGGAMRFLRTRAARLWPVIAIGAVIGAAFRMIETGQSVRAMLAQALLLVPDFRHAGLIFPLNGPHWSMMLEVIANLVHALVLRKLADRSVVTLAALGGLALAVAILGFGSATFGPDSDNWTLGFARIGFSYPLGVWLARRWKRHQPLRVPMPQDGAWMAGLLLPITMIVLLPLLPVVTAVGDMLAILVLFPPLLWFAASATPPRSAAKWLRLAGLLSFPLYAVHLPILEYVAGLHLGTAGLALAVLASLVAAALVAQVPSLPAALPMLRFRRRRAFPLP